MPLDTNAEIRALRTVLRDLVALSAIPTAWVGREPAAVTAGLADALSGPLADALDGQITGAEIAALRRRACRLLENPVMPGPNRHRAIPWPAF